jgi:hypothetical protein
LPEIVDAVGGVGVYVDYTSCIVVDA